MTSDDTLAVAVLGTGITGREVIEGVTSRPGLRLTDVLVHNPEKVGQEFAGVRAAPMSELGDVLSRGEVDTIVYCGLAEPESLLGCFSAAIDAGADVVSLAGPVHFETALGSDMTRYLERRAKARGTRIVATGVNPGFLLDVLPVTCASLALDPRGIVATRVSDISTWGTTILREFGIGDDPAAREPTIHVSLAESVALIRDALRLPIDRIDERVTFLESSARVTVDDLVVEAGAIGGFEVTCVGIRGEEAIVRLEWRGELAPGGAGRVPHEVVVCGDVNLECRLTGDFLERPHTATAARALNTARLLRELPPGLYRPDQLPLGVGNA